MTRPLRVAVINGWIHPWESDLWSACRRIGIDVTLVGQRTRPGIAAEGPVHFLEPRILSTRSQNIWWTYPRLGSLLTELSPDIIHVHSEAWGLLVQQALLATALRRINSIVCAHGADNIFSHGNPLEQAIRRRTLRVLLPKLGGYASWNAEGIDLAKQHGLPDDTPTVVVPAVVYFPERFPASGLEDQVRARQAFGIPVDAFVIGFIGRLVPEKGLSDLVQAVAALEPRRRFLAIWGTGPLESHLTSSLERSGIGGLLGGWLPFERVPLALTACDVVVVPSYSTPTVLEQFSRVGLEAMLAGQAIVATRSGAFPAVFGDAALLVPEHDPAALRAAITRLNVDGEARKDLGERARRRALTEFHPERLASRLSSFWELALTCRDRRPGT